MNRYLIVTNDEMEYPVAEVDGTKKVAEYIGVSTNYISKCIYLDDFRRMKYKAVIIEKDIRKSRINGKNNPKAQRRWHKKYSATHDRREYQREYYKKRKESKLCKQS